MTRSSCRGRALPVVVLILVWLTAAATAHATAVRPVFHQARPAGLVISGSGYALITSVDGQRLIDVRTGRTKYVSRSGCTAGMFGGSWLAFNCGQAIWLYQLSTGHWKLATSDWEAACPPPRGSQYSCDFVGLGSYWLKYEAGCLGCLTTTLYQNIFTHHIRQDPTKPGGTIIADPDTPELARQMCPPLRVPSAADDGRPAALAIRYFGKYAILENPVTTPSYQASYWSFERCGSARTFRIDSSEVQADPQLLVWRTNAGRLEGLWPRTSKTFSIELPQIIHDGSPWFFVLALNRLFLELDSSNSPRLLYADLPFAAPKPRHRAQHH